MYVKTPPGFGASAVAAVTPQARTAANSDCSPN